MPILKDRKLLLIIAGAILVLAGLTRLFSTPPVTSVPEPEKGVYYTGPMKGKGPNAGYGTDEGRAVPAPVRETSDAPATVANTAP